MIDMICGAILGGLVGAAVFVLINGSGDGW